MVVKILLVALMGWMLTSFDTDYTQAQDKPPTKVIYYTVKQGETLWEIGERFYDGSKPFDAWMCDFRKANGFEVGSGRKYLYAGEIVKVVVRDEKSDRK